MDIRIETDEEYAEIRTPLKDGRELLVVLNLGNNIVQVQTVAGRVLDQTVFCECIPPPVVGRRSR